MPFGAVPASMQRPSVPAPPAPARNKDPYGLETRKPETRNAAGLGASSQQPLAELAQQSNTGESQPAAEGGIEMRGSEIDGSPGEKVELAPLHEFVPQAVARPSAAAPSATANGSAEVEATLREALGKASKELIEKIAWEVVPELAETIIREELERLVKEKASQS